MNYRILTLFAAGLHICLSAFAAPPKVTNVVAAQQVGTKLVNITYNLELDEGETAYVELWFSADNGLSFPISAKSVTGNVNAGVTDGVSKTAVWNAGVDWDQRFTQHGKIRVIALYGDQPSGNTSGHWQGDSNLATLELKDYWEKDPGGGDNYVNNPSALSDSGADVVKADTAEVTNAEWNEVAEWAIANGYDLLPLVPGSAEGDKPVTGINYWQAIKWCNARSEKEGLEPAYYLDMSEVIGDLNGDGQITNGADLFRPWDGLGEDLNNNGKWDDGEPFHDDNGNGIFEPEEWVDINASLAVWTAFGPLDFNANGIKDGDEPDDPGLDHGLTQVFRTGATIPGYGAPVVYTDGPAAGLPISGIISSDRNHTKLTAQGYRLPTQQIQTMLAIAGNHKKLWPWGDATISQAASQFSESGIVSTQPDGFWPDGPLSAASRGSNAFGLKDILGNVAEWSEGAWDSGIVDQGIQASVFGGSYLGLDSAGTRNPDTGLSEGSFADKGLPTENLFGANISGPADDSTPAIGLRCVRYK